MNLCPSGNHKGPSDGLISQLEVAPDRSSLVSSSPPELNIAKSSSELEYDCELGNPDAETESLNCEADSVEPNNVSVKSPSSDDRLGDFFTYLHTLCTVHKTMVQ